MQKLVLALACCTGLAACDETLNKAAPDLAMMSLPDLSPAADFSMRVVQPFTCNGMTCSGGKVCCATATSATMVTQTCEDSCGDGGVVEMCGGPQNCATGSACCVTINFMMSTVDGGMPSATGGNTMCTTSCMVGLDLANNQIQTELCQTKSDCAGLSGSLLGTTVQFDGCCTRTGTPGLQFCAPSTFGGRAGLVCP